MKQGNENFDFIKESDEENRNYIFQNNSITKTGGLIVIGFLAIISFVLIFTGTELF